MTQNLLHGMLETLILNALKDRKLHGYGIIANLKRNSKEALAISEGSLYPALCRLQRKGWVVAEWGKSENNRKAKFYQLSEDGHQQLATHKEEWKHFSYLISGVLNLETG